MLGFWGYQTGDLDEKVSVLVKRQQLVPTDFHDKFIRKINIVKATKHTIFVIARNLTTIFFNSGSEKATAGTT